MKKCYPILILSALVLMFTSCNSLRIEKRHYRDGFYISYDNQKEHTSASTGTVIAATEAVAESGDEGIIPVSTPEVAATEMSSEITEPVVENITQPTVEAEDPIVPVANSNETIADQKAVDDETPATPMPHDDVMLVLLVLLAIFLPPLAVYLVEGVTKWFWITLILCIFGGGFFFHPVIGGLWLIAIVIALLVVFELL